jgi:hypothetical protein
MSSDFEQNMMDHLMEIKATSASTAQSLGELRDGLKVVIPELDKRVRKVETKQAWIIGLGTGLNMAWAALCAWFGLHK